MLFTLVQFIDPYVSPPESCTDLNLEKYAKKTIIGKKGMLNAVLSNIQYALPKGFTSCQYEKKDFKKKMK